MNAATTKIQDLRALVDIALALAARQAEPHTADLAAALHSAEQHVARALAEASATLSTPPAPALERVAVKDLKIGDRVLVAFKIDDEATGSGDALARRNGRQAWVLSEDEVLRDPREVRS